MSTDVHAEFARLYMELYERTWFHSNMGLVREDPAYAGIVALGHDIVPTLRELLADESTQSWVLFLLLRNLFGAEGPVIPTEHKGRIREVSQDGLDWFEQRDRSGPETTRA